MKNEPLIESAIRYFAKLPGFGPRSARKTMLYFLKNKDLIEDFVANLNQIKNQIKLCVECNNISIQETCDICLNPNREKNKICVVCDVDDIWSIEKSGTFKGLYHSLGGNLSAISGITPDKLNLQSLFSRLASNQFDEIIFANNTSIEGATTVFYIIDEIEKLQAQGTLKEIKITELANGIPLGASLEYMDEGTIEAAFNSRKSIG